jgi:hypothetical protein
VRLAQRQEEQTGKPLDRFRRGAAVRGEVKYEGASVGEDWTGWAKRFPTSAHSLGVTGELWRAADGAAAATRALQDVLPEGALVQGGPVEVGRWRRRASGRRRRR